MNANINDEYNSDDYNDVDANGAVCDMVIRGSEQVERSH
jgi:hypothetical protein